MILGCKSVCLTLQVNLILPDELYDLIWQDVAAKINVLEYSRVTVSLSEIIDGDFFNKYIKSGISPTGCWMYP